MAENIGVKTTRGALDYNDGDALGPDLYKISLTEDVLAPGSNTRREFDRNHEQYMTDVYFAYWDSLIEYMDECFRLFGRSWIVLKHDRVPATADAHYIETITRKIHILWEKVWQHVQFIRENTTHAMDSNLEKDYLFALNNSEGFPKDPDNKDKIRAEKDMGLYSDKWHPWDNYLLTFSLAVYGDLNTRYIRPAWTQYLDRCNGIFVEQRDENKISIVKNSWRIHLLSLVTAIVHELHHLHLKLISLSKLVEKQENATALHNSLRPGGKLYKQAKQRYETRDYKFEHAPGFCENPSETQLEYEKRQQELKNERVGQTKPMRIPRSFFKT